MKKLLFIVITAFFIIEVTVLLSSVQKSPNTTTISTIQTVSPTPVQSLIVNYNNQPYRIYYSPLTRHKISLIPNFQKQRDALTIAQENNCQTSSSGGFYSEDNKPLGLFKVNNEVLGKQIADTKLLTGFFYIDAQGSPHIGTSVPDNAPIALQTGPVIWNNQPMSTVDDKQARRIVIVETTTNEHYLATVILEEDELFGPTLRDLPPILFSIDQPFKVNKALNLDGGKASFYTNGKITLSERTYVGSIICIY